jgi:hypothetical protein
VLEGDLTRNVLGHVGRHAGGALRPGDPEPAVGGERCRESTEPTLEVGPGVNEGDDHVDGTGRALFDAHAVWERPERAREALRGAGKGDSVPRLDAELPRERRSGVSGHGGSVSPATKLSLVTDDGHAVHYTAVERGTPVYSSDDVQVGTVDQVVDNYREHILDGIVLKGSDGAIRFVDAPEVARTFERAVRLTIPADEVAQLPPPDRGAGSFRANVRAGRLSRLFGGGWKRG